ncbi:MAG: BatD family protein [Endomicrobium sp.]|jgi:hypothetical protein|nr:BatD family protein [Endomicrobium sp.]
MLRKTIFLFVLLFITSLSLLYANIISFKASLDRNSVPLNESFIYSVIVSGDNPDLPEPTIGNMPEFSRFGTSTSQSMSIINGKVSVSITYKYTLRAKTIGKFQIAPAKIALNGHVYFTDTMGIEITPVQSVHTLQQNISFPKVQKSPSYTGQQKVHKQLMRNSVEKVFVKASVNKMTVYENEKLIYRFSFYTNVDLISNPEYFAPNFSGFWNDGSKTKSHFEVVNGSNYHVDDIETTLYPIGRGTKIIEPAKIKVAVMDFYASDVDEMDDLFNIFTNIGRGQTKMLETNIVTVDVLSLPNEGRPLDFSGAVGNFKIKAFVDKREVNTNEPVTLTIVVSGNDDVNMKSVSGINFCAFDGFKKYDTIVATASDNLKEFKTIFIPLTTGVKEIPVASLSFFNPVKKQYETIKTQPQKINVSGGTVYSESDSGHKAKINNVRKDINYNKQIKKLKSYKGYLLKNHMFYLIFVPFIFLLIFSLGYKFIKMNGIAFKKKNSIGFGKFNMFVNNAREQIAKNNLNFAFDLIYQALMQIVSIKTKISFEDLRKRTQIADILNENNFNIDKETLDQIVQTLKRFNFYKFASINLDKDSLNLLLNDVYDLGLRLENDLTVATKKKNIC